MAKTYPLRNAPSCVTSLSARQFSLVTRDTLVNVKQMVRNSTLHRNHSALFAVTFTLPFVVFLVICFLSSFHLCACQWISHMLNVMLEILLMYLLCQQCGQ